VKFSLASRTAVEFLGTAFLVAAVVGSGIMGERLSAGNDAIALLANTLATGAALVALILAFGSISGAHFNPVVTVMEALRSAMHRRDVLPYILAQFLGGVVGSLVAHIMFGLPAISLSLHARSGPAQFFSEFVATFGLLCVIFGAARSRPAAIPIAVGAYITAAYWFTASTSFANPAVTLARCITNTFAGIRPIDVPWFILAQCLGGFCATILFGAIERSALAPSTTL